MVKKFLTLLLLTVFSGLVFGGETPMNDTIATILKRKSVRTFKAEPVAKEKLETIVRAGMAAPTAVDKRPWEFIVVTDKALLKKLADTLPYAKMTEKAAAAILVLGNLDTQFGGREADFWITDCSAATENILLAVESLGLGAVWTAVYPDKERVVAVRSLFKLPENMVPLNVIPLGVPGGDEKPKDKWNPKQLHWNKW